MQRSINIGNNQNNKKIHQYMIRIFFQLHSNINSKQGMNIGEQIFEIDTNNTKYE